MRISDWISDVCSSDLDGPVEIRRGILFSRISRIDLMPKSFRTASASWSSCEKEATADRSSLRGVHPRSTLPSAAEFANQAGDVMAKSYLPSSTIRLPPIQALPQCIV